MRSILGLICCFIFFYSVAQSQIIPLARYNSSLNLSLSKSDNVISNSGLNYWEDDRGVDKWNLGYESEMFLYQNRFLIQFDSMEWNNNIPIRYHTFIVKYRPFDYGKIHYHGDLFSRNINASNDTMRFFTKYSDFGGKYEKSSFDLLNQRVLIANPSLAKYHWDSIPSPHQQILDGVLLSKKAAREAFSNKNVIGRKELFKPVVVPEKWTIGGVESLQLSQAYFANWVKGGQNAISITSDLRVKANYKHKKLQWDNKGIHKLGFINSEGEPIRINDDLLQLTSKLGIEATERWFYSSLVEFKSQFFYGRDEDDWNEILSGFLAPAYFTFTLGMDYKANDFTLLLSPFSTRSTFVRDTAHIDASRYGIEDGGRSQSQSGASVTNSFKWKVNSEMVLVSNLDLFYGYLNSEPETQFDWELIFDMRINKYLSTRINTNMRYFQSESRKLQFKENFSLVFSYKF